MTMYNILYKIYIIIVFCCVVALSFKDLQNNKWFTHGSQFENIPDHGDLIEYLGALNRLINFSSKHEIDINGYFGLFLVNVNLKRVVQKKHHALPKKLLSYVKQILLNTEKVLDNFKETIQNSHDKKNKALFSLFMNETSWIYRLPNFIFIHLQTKATHLKEFDRTWTMYRKNVDDRMVLMPNPYESDICLVSLALAKEIQNGPSQRCNVLKYCYEIVENGTDYGYALAHRLLFLQQARFGSGCSVFSEQEDLQMGRKFCTAAYKEVQYITQNKFQMIDLLLEHVCLCALEGYAEFLKRSWLTKILSFQTARGCFTPCLRSTGCEDATLGDRGTDGYCNGHTTAVAAGVLAAASRFTIELYY